MVLAVSAGLGAIWLGAPAATAQVENPQSDSVGMQGTIGSAPPQTGAHISVPTNGQVFTQLPVTVSGMEQRRVGKSVWRV